VAPQAGHTLVRDQALTALCAVLLASLGIVAMVGPAAAADTWVLWERSVDLKGDPHGEWRRGQVFDTERWCKGAMTNAINQALVKAGQQRGKGGLAEYQCLPETVDPRTAKGKQ